MTTPTIEQVSVGFDTYQNLISSAVAEGANTVYPPYNVRKTSNTTYAIDIDVSGFHSEDIKASIQDGYLSVASSNGILSIFSNPGDVFFNKTIVAPTDFTSKFWIADGLKLDGAQYLDGIITFSFSSTGINQTKTDVPIVYQNPVSANTNSNTVVVNTVANTSFNSGVVAPVDTPVPVAVTVANVAPNVVPVILNGSDTTQPTVQVNVPNPLPQILQVNVAKPVGAVDPSANTPQVVLNVTDATKEVAANSVVTGTVPVQNGAPTVVAVPTDLNNALNSAGINAVSSVAQAVSQANVTPVSAPDANVVSSANTLTVTASDTTTNAAVVNVVTPAVIPSVVQATVDTSNAVPTVTLSTAPTDIPKDSTITPVVTANGQPDIMVVTSPGAQAALNSANVNVATDIGQTLQDANVAVITSNTTPTN